MAEYDGNITRITSNYMTINGESPGYALGFSYNYHI